jgi:hypothetical protein
MKGDISECHQTLKGDNSECHQTLKGTEVGEK